MKSNPFFKFFAIILSASLSALIFSGCSEGAGWESSQANSSTPTASVPAISSTPTSETPSAPEESTPAGEPTFLIGLDGEAILTSEITRLENTDKTAETLTTDDLWAEVYCEGFTYVKEPSGVAFDSYKNPELFDGDDYLGERAENTNEWKRVYVGDEICGLKVKSASVVFEVNDYDLTIPERYLSLHDFGCCELEGTIEIEGFLQVFPLTVQYAETSELVEFMPCESKLPITPVWNASAEGYPTRVEEHILYNHYGDFGIYGELDRIAFGHLNDQTCDMDGIGRGDIAYARVTLGNIRCVYGTVSATLENVERISDILAHNEDITEIHQPAPVL